MGDVSFGGRAVLVFGAAGALGAGVAAAFAAAGGVGHRGGPGRAPGRAAGWPGSAYRSRGRRRRRRRPRTCSTPGRAPWAVLNTVGGFAGRRPLAELDLAELTGQIELNLVTAALITKHALRRHAARGRGPDRAHGQPGGRGHRGSGFAYSVSKAGVLHLVSMAADEVRGTGITVNCVVPSIIDTPVNRAAMPDANHAAWPKIPDIARTLRVPGQPGVRAGERRRRAGLTPVSPASGLVNGAAMSV